VIGAVMVGGAGVAQAIDAPYAGPLPPATTFKWDSTAGQSSKSSHHTIQLVDIEKDSGENDHYWWEYEVDQKVSGTGEIRRWGLGVCNAGVISDPRWNGPPWPAQDVNSNPPLAQWAGKNAPYDYVTLQAKGAGSGEWKQGTKRFRVKVAGAWAVDSTMMFSAIQGTGRAVPLVKEAVLAAPGCNGLVDLGITKTLTSAATVEPGGTVSYTVTVTNNGWWDIPWGSMKVDDPGATLVPDATEPPELLKGASFSWTATKPVAASTEVCGTTVTNTASVSVAAAVPPLSIAQRKRLAKMSKAKRAAFLERVKKASNGVAQQVLPTGFVDPVAGNNSATAAGVLVTGGICPVDTPVTPASVPEVVAFRPAGAPTLAVEKTGTARVLAGGNLLYRITVRNTGAEPATGVVLTDTPPGTMLWRAVPTGATRAGRTVSWNIGTLEGGQSVTASIRLKMRRTATGRSCNVASATSTNAGSARDRACTTVSVARRPATPVTG
jgi:uncharacterized repeat protein (TIGR01451 family)